MTVTDEILLMECIRNLQIRVQRLSMLPNAGAIPYLRALAGGVQSDDAARSSAVGVDRRAAVAAAAVIEGRLLDVFERLVGNGHEFAVCRLGMTSKKFRVFLQDAYKKNPQL